MPEPAQLVVQVPCNLETTAADQDHVVCWLLDLIIPSGIEIGKRWSIFQSGNLEIVNAAGS
jgi:hypothetical protein